MDKSKVVLGHQEIFFNDTATTEIYTLSLHDALPILPRNWYAGSADPADEWTGPMTRKYSVVTEEHRAAFACRSEEHTSELQSRQYLACRLLLAKKNHRRAVEDSLWRGHNAALD